MELRNARLCLDCEDVHEQLACPVCGSESFAYLSRWVPAPEPGRRARTTTSEDAEVYRELLATGESPSVPGRLLRRGLVGLTALGLAGWAWRFSRASSPRPDGPLDDGAEDSLTAELADAPPQPSNNEGVGFHLRQGSGEQVSPTRSISREANASRVSS